MPRLTRLRHPIFIRRAATEVHPARCVVAAAYKNIDAAVRVIAASHFCMSRDIAIRNFDPWTSVFKEKH